jgi:hypothetical protein
MPSLDRYFRWDGGSTGNASLVYHRAFESAPGILPRAARGARHPLSRGYPPLSGFPSLALVRTRYPAGFPGCEGNRLVPQFRAYADYMATPEFRAGLDELLDLLPEGPLTVLCAEALPWRCHRTLLSDSVLIRGIPVFHILSSGKLKPHALPDFARVDTREDPPRLTYPLAEEAQARLL